MDRIKFPPSDEGVTALQLLNHHFFDILEPRIDVVAHFDSGGDLPVIAYLAAQYNERGDRRVFFRNRGCYTEGSGSSNIGPINSGLAKSTTEDNSVQATVTWSGGTYTYVIENIMAHPAMQMHQIGVPLYQSRTFLQPARTVVLGHPTVFSVRVSPTVRWRSGLKGAIPESFGTVTIYSSRNQVDWTPMYSSMPDNGYASFSLMFPEAATYYLKAKFTGDGVIEPSERSIERVTVNKVPTSLAISFTPVVVDALKGEYTTITVSLVPSLSGRSVRLYYARSSAGPRIVIGTCLTDVSGRCLKQWFPTASMYPGSYYLVAEWDGDSQYASARVNSAAFNPPKITVIPEFESSSIMMIVAVLVVLTINLRRAWTHTRTDKSSSSSRTT